MESKSWLAAGLLLLSTLLAGCASLAARSLLPEVQARRPPDVNLGPELVLGDHATSVATSLIDRDGRVHIFLTAGQWQLQHIEVLGDKVVSNELLGAIEHELHMSIDAVEQPAGKLRVLIGDKQFVRPAPNQQWQEIKGNRCQRFLPIKDDLFCAFVIKGEEVNAPKRTDYYGGFFLISPFFFWKTRQAAKLVIAQEEAPGTSVDSWKIRAVVDPETPLDAESDFMVGTDNQGTLHVLYSVTRGGSFGFLVCYFGCAGAGSEPAHTLLYAQVPFDRLVPQAPQSQNQDSSAVNGPTLWLSVQGTLLPPMLPSLGWDWERMKPLQRHFTLNKASGDIGGLLGGFMTMSGVGNARQFEKSCCESLWVELGIRDGTWLPGVDVVAAKDLPDATYLWLEDEHALMRSDTKGNSHALLNHSELGFSRRDFIVYFMKSGGNWSAPLNLGRLNSRSISYSGSLYWPRDLAVSDSGSAFATWVNEEGKFVGRWIRPIQKAPP